MELKQMQYSKDYALLALTRVLLLISVNSSDYLELLLSSNDPRINLCVNDFCLNLMV